MDIILIPGLWLDGSSWEQVVPVLEKAGHRAHPMTLPGMESKDADRSQVTLRDHVDAVVAAVDAVDGQVVLVGHSAGAAIAHAAVDARPDRVAHVVYVGGFPTGDGDAVVDGFTGGERRGPAAGVVGLRGGGTRRSRRRARSPPSASGRSRRPSV